MAVAGGLSFSPHRLLHTADKCPPNMVLTSPRVSRPGRERRKERWKEKERDRQNPEAIRLLWAMLRVNPASLQSSWISHPVQPQTVWERPV